MAHQSLQKAFWHDAWRPILFGLALLQGYLLLGTERDRLEEVHTISKRLAHQTNAELYDPARDPRPGQRLPRLQLNDIKGINRIVPPPALGKRSVVVFVGACTPCVADKLRLWQQAATAERPIYVVTQGDPEEVKSFRRQFKLTLPFFFERVATAALRPYNATWRPRAYLLDGQAHLLYIQPRQEDSETTRDKVLRLTELS